MKQLITVLVLTLSFSLQAQIIPQSKKITTKFFPDSNEIENTTPALQKKKGFTDYEELMSFLNSFADLYPDKFSISFIGKSQKGRDIPMVNISLPNGKEKIKVFMQGGLHGNEPASTETMLYLIDRLFNDEAYSNLIDQIDLAIIPMANIDGYLKNNRYAANGLDLNRDHTKLMAPETVAIKKAYSEFNPHVSVDFHEYRPYRRDYAKMGDFGVTNKYDLMFLASSNLNVPQNLRDLTNNLFVKNAGQSLDQYEYRHYPYISTTKVNGEIHINQGSISSRSFATNTALTNSISSLIEIRGVGLKKTSFKRRMHCGFLVAISYLKTASENMKLVKEEIEKANTLQNDVVVEYKRGVYEGDVSFIDVNTSELVELQMTIRDAAKAKATLTRERPVAYIVDSSQTQVIQKLKALGVELELIENERTYNVESYVVAAYFQKPIKYEKMKLQTVDTKLLATEKSFPEGTAIVYMDQKRANIVPELLEPEAPNSLVSFGIIKTQEGETLPIYRLLN
jgi:hypothetical protein